MSCIWSYKYCCTINNLYMMTVITIQYHLLLTLWSPQWRYYHPSHMLQPILLSQNLLLLSQRGLDPEPRQFGSVVTWKFSKIVERCTFKIRIFARMYVKLQRIDRFNLYDNLGTPRMANWPIIIKILIDLRHLEVNFRQHWVRAFLIRPLLWQGWLVPRLA